MNITLLIQKLTNFTGDWLRVNDELCIHCFIDEYYVILCKYQRNGDYIIRVDVDDIEQENYDIIKEDYTEGSEIYKKLLPIYKSAKPNAKSAYRKAG